MFTPDELAGVVDLFGALTRAELAEALSELAYRQGETVPDDAVDEAIDAFALVTVERDDDEDLLAPGPSAFPTLPEGAEDLPHILDVEARSVDRSVVGRAAERRLRADAARAVANDEPARAAELLDVSYDLEAWGGVELDDIRDRLDAARDETN
ncbi:hypothetical protein KY092_14395 [Natronomonas gomsonensis]|jgi:hypothetical protein|uniref:DUF7109 family protein n=1 Tax=Natronomonas gomsonensis TaxID=1046043 RepID=UPI0020CA53E9|nr:hypothetical protein [Natronomonas gomsonensis]MCY4731745.1 hypothetical protein [Natronomonas gomsonensis]